MIIDFEDLEKRCNKAVESEAYALLTEKVEKAKKIFLLGNGGLHYVASHMATDLSRLVPDKTVYSFDSVGFITSNANDHGYEQLFGGSTRLHWLKILMTAWWWVCLALETQQTSLTQFTGLMIKSSQRL